jgi:hypothetical protein
VGSPASEDEARRGVRADDPDLPVLRRIAAGDRPACATLVNRHLSRIVAIGLRMLCILEDAEVV